MKTISTPTKNTIQVGRFSIPYRVYGDRGPSIICLNGIQQSMAMWSSFVHRFKKDYKIVLFDFPGQGKGKILSGSHQLSLEEQVEILHQIIKATNIDSLLTLCTASWGGVIAVMYAAQYPTIIDRLICGSMGTRPNQNMIDTISKGMEVHSDNREKMAEILLSSFGGNLPDGIKNKITLQFQNMTPENLKTFYEHGLFVISNGNLDQHIDFSKIQAKTILINGEEDKIIDLEDVKDLVDKIPHCTLEIVKNVGHFLHLESDDVFDVYQSALNSH